jgi:predicted nucleic acid-binding protein
MSYLLDTNVVSELRKGHRMDSHVQSWFSGVAAEQIWLSVLVVAELRRGAEVVRRRDPRQAAALDRWIETLVRAQNERILPVDQRVADEWGRLSAIRAGSVVDLLLAGTALVHSLVLVTRNEKHVVWTGVECLNPFKAGGTRR